MWEVRTQFSKPSTDSVTGELEWSSVMVDTEAAAESWWAARTSRKQSYRRVSTLFDPEGNVKRVMFN